jgi:RNA polymerase sigma-70 factor (ECF subfamily)
MAILRDFLAELLFFLRCESAKMVPMRAQVSTHTTLMRRLASGNDQPAWTEFCDRYGELIRGFAQRQGLQSADCDEILQDVLLALTKAMPGFEYDPAKGKFRSYLKTVVLRAIFRKNRQERPPALLGDIEEAVQAATTDAELEAGWEEEWRKYHVRSAMRVIDGEFNEDAWAAFQSYAVEGHDPKETARALGLTLNQVYRAKSQITRRLREVVRRQVADEG